MTAKKPERCPAETEAVCQGVSGYEWECYPYQCELVAGHVGYHEAHGVHQAFLEEYVTNDSPWVILWGPPERNDHRGNRLQD